MKLNRYATCIQNVTHKLTERDRTTKKSSIFVIFSKKIAQVFNRTE